MAFNLGRYGSRDVLNLQFFDAATNAPLMTMDYAKTSSQEIQSTRVYAMGAGSRRIAWDGEKTATLKVDTQIFSMEHLAMLAGEDIKEAAQNIYRTEIAKVEADGSNGMIVNLQKAPVGDIVIYPFVNGVAVKQNQKGAATGKVVKLDASATVKVGDDVEVFYQSEVKSAHKLSFTAKSFPKYVKLVGDTIFMDEVSTEAAAVQTVFYKAKLQPNFTLSSGSEGDPTTLSLVFDLFPQKINGEDTIADMIVYDSKE